jgi:hypothetical protein
MPARYVTNRYGNTSSVTSMLGDLEWDTLETRRKKIRLTMMYKIINNLIDIRAEEYLTKPTKRIIRSHKSKDRQCNTMTKRKRTNNDLQNYTREIYNTDRLYEPVL